VFIFRDKEPKKDPEDEGTTILPNTVNYSPSDTASHRRIPAASRLPASNLQ
jgi:hypothetical protein